LFVVQFVHGDKTLNGWVYSMRWCDSGSVWARRLEFRTWAKPIRPLLHETDGITRAVVRPIGRIPN
jgi:hypothetical protein